MSSRAEPNDAAVHAALGGGDCGAALTLLLKAHGHAIRRHCHKLLRDRAFADDVYQTVILQAFEDLPSFAGRATFCTWLHSIAHHRCLDAIKSRRRWSARFVLPEELPDEPDLEPSSEDRLDARSMSRALAQCFDDLPSDVRRVLLLRFEEGLTYEEMSRICHERPATLQARVARALPQLRRLLEAKMTKSSL